MAQAALASDRRVTQASGFTLWLTGLSGAGKSTLAVAVSQELRSRGAAVEVLDGDEGRQNLSKGLGFSRADRDTNIRRIGYVAKLLTRNGVAGITTAVSPPRGGCGGARRRIRPFAAGVGRGRPARRGPRDNPHLARRHVSGPRGAHRELRRGRRGAGAPDQSHRPDGARDVLGYPLPFPGDVRLQGALRQTIRAQSRRARATDRPRAAVPDRSRPLLLDPQGRAAGARPRGIRRMDQRRTARPVRDPVVDGAS